MTEPAYPRRAQVWRTWSAIVLAMALLGGSSVAAAFGPPPDGDSTKDEHDPDQQGPETSSEAADPGILGVEEPADPPPAAATEKSTPAPGPSEAEQAAAAQEAATGRERLLRIEKILLRASRVRALARGELAASVAAEPLFSIDPFDPNLLAALDLAQFLEAVRAARADREERRGSRRLRLEDPPELPNEPTLEDARRELRAALIEYLSLPQVHRDQLLSEHRAAHAQWLAAEQAERLDRERLVRLTQQAQLLEAFLSGQLDPSIDPRPLLQLAVIGERDVAAGPRLQRLLEATAEESAAKADAPDEKQVDPPTETDPKKTSGDAVEPGLEAQLAAAELRLDRARLRFFALDPTERRALLEAHLAPEPPPEESEEAQREEEKVEQEIDEAEREAEEADVARSRELAAAAKAARETTRAVAEAKAALLEHKSDLATLRAETGRYKRRMIASHEDVLRWQRIVREIREGEGADSSGQSAIDSYLRLVDELSQLQDLVEEALRTLRAPSDVPAPPEDGLAGAPEGKRREITDLKEEVASLRVELQQLEREVRWEVLESVHGDLLALNDKRLDLLELLDEHDRVLLVGLTPAGLDHARMEFRQLHLSFRYWLRFLPRDLASRTNGFDEDPLGSFYALLQTLLVVLAFFVFRARGGAAVERWRQAALRERPRTRRSQSRARLLYYAGRVQKPAALLVALWVSLQILETAWAPPGLRFVRLTINWVVGGTVVIRILDAASSRRRRERVFEDGRAALRLRSLRLVGYTTVAVGLTLSLAAIVVGRGTLFAWTWRGCWFLAIPLVAVLLWWWRHEIPKLLEDRREARVAHRLARAMRGWRRPLVMPLAGAFLLFDSAYRELLRQAASLELTRRLMAYFFRRRVARAHRDSDEQLEPLTAEEFELAGPETPSTQVLESLEKQAVNDLVELVRPHRDALAVVVGERGSGKTTVLRRIAEAFGPEQVVTVQCPPSDFRGLLDRLAVAVGLGEGAHERDILAAIADRKLRAVCVDDVHRIVRPVIGGFDDLDRLVSLGRLTPETSWILAIGAAAWTFISRARDDHAMFDQTIVLEAWDEGSITDLALARSRETDLEPSFEELDLPRQLDADHDLPATVRKRQGYGRILWHAARGNPGVALHLWGRSLFRNRDGQLVVRLFETPSTEALSSLPSSAYVVLKALVQLETASKQDLVAATAVGEAAVADALRAATVHGWLDWNDDRARIRWDWYRPITDVLQRQQVLVM